jgi:hypothetical protein
MTVVFYTWMFGLALAYLALLGVLVFRKESRGIVVSLLFFGVALATGYWGIKQSHSSTAAIGFLFLPSIATVAGVLGLAFGRFRRDPAPGVRAAAWLSMAAALALVSCNVAEGAKTRTRNRVREAYQADFSAEVATDRRQIDSALAENPKRERAWLDSSIRARMNDRVFLLAALTHDSISPTVLDTVATLYDLDIALEAIRNPNASSATLERVYRTKSYPDYFFQTLAAHRNTPPAILRELFQRPRTVTGLDIWFAGNPSTPHEILDQIARTNTDRSVLGALLENPAITCPILTQVAVNLMKGQNRDAEDANVMRLNELLPSKCPNTTQ